MNGGGGADLLNGQNGSDTADYAGSASAVIVDLSDGAPEAGGDAAGDTLVGIENVSGSSHDDTLTGDTGSNVLAGASGDDSLLGGEGDDTLIGGAGADVLDGGSETDTADYEKSGAAVNVSLDVGLGSGGEAEGDTLTGIENLVGSAFGDTLTGDAGANRIDGRSGADQIEGGDGDDTITGRIDGNLISGGAGFDWLQYDAYSGLVIDLASGTAAATINAEVDTISGIEGVLGAAVTIRSSATTLITSLMAHTVGTC